LPEATRFARIDCHSIKMNS